jgi:GGDEF domain-containing protein
VNDIGPWLVVGGAALVVLCAAVTVALLLRVLRRSRRALADAASARSALGEAAAGGATDERLMPLLLGAAIEATGAAAGVVTVVREGDRRRSYSTGLHVHEARSAIDELVDLRPQELVRRHRGGVLPASVVLPIERPGITGALAVYWRDEGLLGEIPTADLEELLATAFQPLPGAAEAPGTDGGESERWSRLADLTATLEPAALLRKIVAAALAECGADAAAARMPGPAEQEPVSEVRGFAEHERPWAESVLASEAVVPSITRYIAAREAPAASEPSIATALVVPLRAPDGGTVGNLVAVWRADLGERADRKVVELELVADDARAALGNATRFQQLQALAVRDPATGLFDAQYFFGRLAGAVDAARRSGEPLVLLVFAAAEIEAGAPDLRVASLEQALASGSARIASAVGELGVTCRLGLGEFASILPNTDLARAQASLAAVTQELPREAAGETPLRWSASAVELGDGERADELWQRARRELDAEVAASAQSASRPATIPIAGGTMRLALGGRADPWTLRQRAPGNDAPDAD